MTRPTTIGALCILALSSCAAREPVTVWECDNYGINNINPGPKDNKVYVGLQNNSSRRLTYARVIVTAGPDHFNVEWRGTIEQKAKAEFAAALNGDQQMSVMDDKGEVQCSVSVAQFDDGTKWYPPKDAH